MTVQIIRGDFQLRTVGIQICFSTQPENDNTLHVSNWYEFRHLLNYKCIFNIYTLIVFSTLSMKI